MDEIIPTRSIIINSEKLLEEFLADLIKSNQQNVNMNDSLFENFVAKISIPFFDSRF